MPTTHRGIELAQLQPHRCPSTHSSILSAKVLSPIQLRPEVLPRYTEDLSYSNFALRDTVPSFLQCLQKVLARLLADPEFTRKKLFRFLAPIVVFLSLIMFMATSFAAPDPETSSWVAILGRQKHWVERVVLLCIMAVGSIVGILVALWLFICLLALCIKRFTEIEFETARRTSARMSDDVMTGLFTN
ncbi:hypothetical protein GYMLUDRAFT_50376 [Collybiopsis luxurians FD-317 M1]|uniref:Uncharacterized protein n=1 Tax=Collybiopsis luxurians FD-317 M1 TaxID=944289 RepID=A0A0D0C1S3_9AGAR|nr:hypothetical protein GYMLUDRAFT_50376 [Collybiopsis luxurians FD-317 M1]